MPAEPESTASAHAGGGCDVVWVFNGLHGSGQHNTWPCAVFSSREKALAWIERTGVRGTLTEMPVDESTYDHAVRVGRFREREAGPSLLLLQTFSSRLEHEHFIPDVE